MFGVQVSAAVVSTFLALLYITVHSELTVRPVNKVMDYLSNVQFNCAATVKYPIWYSNDYMSGRPKRNISLPGCVLNPLYRSNFTVIGTTVGSSFHCILNVREAVMNTARKYTCKESNSTQEDGAAAGLMVIDPNMACDKVNNKLICEIYHNRINRTTNLPTLIAKLEWKDASGSTVTQGLTTDLSLENETIATVDFPTEAPPSKDKPYKCTASFVWSFNPTSDFSPIIMTQREKDSYFCVYPLTERKTTTPGDDVQKGLEQTTPFQSTASVACVEMFALVASLLVIFIARCFQVHTLPTQDVG